MAPARTSRSIPGNSPPESHSPRELRQAGEYELAAYEFGKILILDPDQIAVRMSRALLSIETRRFEQAQRDLDSVLTNPGLIEHIQKDPTFIQRFHHASRQYCLNGKFQEGRAIARRALDLAITLGLPRAESHYNLARAYAISARTEPQFIAEAADQLYQAFVANPINQNNLRPRSGVRIGEIPDRCGDAQEAGPN